MLDWMEIDHFLFRWTKQRKRTYLKYVSFVGVPDLNTANKMLTTKSQIADDQSLRKRARYMWISVSCDLES
jgi:hypothetical protein